MYHTTGLDKAEILGLCEMIHREAVGEERAWPPILGLYRSVVVTLTYLRRNRVQAEIAEAFEVSQSTISRAITTMTDLVERALCRYVPTASIDLNDTHRCPLGHRCESCGTEGDDLTVATATTALGVLCLTLCPRCERGKDVPPVSVGTAARLVAQPVGHIRIDLDEMTVLINPREQGHSCYPEYLSAVPFRGCAHPAQKKNVQWPSFSPSPIPSRSWLRCLVSLS